MTANKRMMKNFLIAYNIIILLTLFILVSTGIILSDINPVYNYLLRTVLMAAMIVHLFYFPRLDVLFAHPVKKKLTTHLSYIRLENPVITGFYFGMGFFLSLVIVYFLMETLRLI